MGLRRSADLLPAILLAGKLGMYGGLFGYLAFGGVVSIRTFSSGALGFTGVADKFRDYAAAGGFVFTFLLAFALAKYTLDRLSQRIPQVSVRSFERGLLFANIPAAFALAGMFFSKSLNFWLFVYSSVAELVLFACAFAWVLGARQPNGRQESRSAAQMNFDWVLPFLFFAFSAGVLTIPGWTAFLMAVKGAAVGQLSLDRVSFVSGWIFAACSASTAIIIYARSDPDSMARRAIVLLGAAQIFVVLGAIVFLGPLIKAGDALQYLLEVSTLGRLSIGLLMIVSAGLIARGIIANAKSAQDATAYLKSGAVLSPVAVVLASVALKLDFKVPRLNLDDLYHTGELALPYWAWTKFHLVPYVDLDPARGWVNLLFGFFGEAFFRPAWANYAFVSEYVMSAAIAFLFVATRPLVGAWGALLLVCLAPPPNSLTEIDLVIAGLLSVICITSFTLEPARWLIVWILTGTVAVLFAPGQGGLLVLATGLLGLARFAEAIQADRQQLIRNTVLLLVVLALVLLSPLAAPIIGAVRYGLEQSAVNTEMNGIAWRLGEQLSPGPFWEAVRSSWLLVTVAVGVSVIAGLMRMFEGRPPSFLRFTRSPYFTIGIPIVILGILFIPRAVGRIEPGSFSRMGAASVWFATILLPLYSLANSERPQAIRPRYVLGFTILAGLFASVLNYTWMAGPFARMMTVANKSDVHNGNEIGLSRLGPYLQGWNLTSVKRAASVKAFVDVTIPREGTFLDLTNHSGLYYLLDRRPAMAAAPYNLTTAGQQRRAIQSLQANPPELVLAGPNAILHDGGSLGLRAPLLFRYIVENYRPMEAEGSTWLKPSAAGHVRSRTEIDLLEKAFGQRNLGALPRIWGSAWNSLNAQLVPLHSADFRTATLHDANWSTDGSVVSTDKNTYAVLDTSSFNMRGSDSGVISFSFSCDRAVSPPILELMWTTESKPEFDPEQAVLLNAENGKIVVPVDASPSWVLGGQITSVRFSLKERASCPSWRISELAFSQRSYFPAP